MGLHNDCASAVLLFGVWPIPEFLLWLPPTAPQVPAGLGVGSGNRGFRCVRSIFSCLDGDMNSSRQRRVSDSLLCALSSGCLSTAGELAGPGAWGI